jgi:hypothetical protein
MVRVITVGIASLALLLGMLATPATANHLSTYIYSPYTGANWYFTQGEHPSRLGSAHDVSWDSWPSSIVFNASGGVTGEVTAVANNCNQTQTWDKYVTLALWVNAEYFGAVSYVHITNPAVSVGQLISPGTSLGSPQTSSSDCWGGRHVHMERSANGEWGGLDFICGFPCPVEQQFTYSTWVIRMWSRHIAGPQPLSGAGTK